MRMVLVAVMVAAALFAGVVLAVDRAPDGIAGAPPRPTVMAVPDEPTAAITRLGDPIWVVPHDDGEVSVLSAVNPHLDILVVWCEQARLLVEEGPASTFAERGRWLGGPAPRGLEPYAVERDVDPRGREVLVIGERLEAPARTVPALVPAGPMCEWSEPDERVVDAVRHDLRGLYGPPVRPEDARPSPQMRLLDARLHAVGEGTARLCSPRDEEGCADDAPRVRGFFHDLGHAEHVAQLRGWRDMPILARRGPAGFHDMAFADAGASWLGFEWVGEPADLFAASARGRAVSVERSGGRWVVHLDRAVAPRGSDGEQAVRLPASARWPLADALTWGDWTVDVPSDPRPGSRLPKTLYSNAEMAERTAQGEKPWVALEMGRDGTVVWAELMSRAEVEFARERGEID